MSLWVEFLISEPCNPAEDSLLIKQALADGWLQCLANPVFKHPLSRSLVVGEQSSIELALQSTNKTLLILDDFLARKQALRNQLNIIGTAALFFAAQRKGLIADAALVIAQLNNIGYRISVEVVSQLKNGMQSTPATVANRSLDINTLAS